MKRVLLSLLCGTCLLFGYFISLALLQALFDLRLETIAALLQPMNLPYGIYKRVFGLYYGDRRVVMILNQVANILLYSAVFYFIFTQYAKLKNKNQPKGIETPPDPPTFN